VGSWLVGNVDYRDAAGDETQVYRRNLRKSAAMILGILSAIVIIRKAKALGTWQGSSGIGITRARQKKG
jgi:hypothetical protein